MRIFHSANIFLACLVVGCASVAEAPQLPYPELVQQAKSENTVDVAELADTFSSERMSVELLADLAQFELQTSGLGDRKLRLGPIGTAILDRCYISLVGHLAMADFYEHLGEEHSQVHKDWISAIEEYVSSGRDGTRSSPYRAFTKPQAEAFLRNRGEQPIGAYYEGTSDTPLILGIVVTGNEQRSEHIFFDLGSTFDLWAEMTETSENSDDRQKRNVVMFTMASTGDSAAQASLGKLLGELGRVQEARRWLNAAIRGGNGYGHVLAARIYAERVRTGRQSSRSTFLTWAHGHYLNAIELGFDPATRELGRLLIAGQRGERAVEEGVKLLEDAAQRNDIAALVDLARISYAGTHSTQDFSRAASYYEKAARLGDAPVRIEYFRFLSDTETGFEVTQQSVDWLMEAANNKNATAMLEIGNCHARGCLDKPNYRKAKSWFRRAVRTEPENPTVVNEVAWTMAVTHIDSLRNPRYALNIMDEMMESNEQARQRPEFLDTWAAAYAATGNFDRAIEIQQQALSHAHMRDELPEEHLDVLKSHLEDFTNGEVVLKPIP